MVKELKANSNSMKQQLSTIESEKEETEMRLREVEIERSVVLFHNFSHQFVVCVYVCYLIVIFHCGHNL